MRRRVIFFFLTIFLLLIGTTLVVLYGRGYRISFEKDKKIISGTGLLVATSNPDGAQIFVNGKLTSATNNTLNLLPEDYAVEITKEGYLPWKKNLKVQNELVTKTDALLFPTAPKLVSITSTGISSPLLDPTKTRLAYKIASLTPQKNGIYILEMGERPILTLQSTATKIVDETKNSFSKAAVSFSPNGKNLIATLSGEARTTYLLSLERENQNPQEVSQLELSQLKEQWQKEKEEKEVSRLASLRPELAKMVTSSFQNLNWSPDETKILYQASQSATLPLFINPPLAGANSQPEERKIEKSKVYIYDIKEDKNFSIEGSLSSLSWFPDSRHLILTDNGKIEILEYDGTNKTTVYAGPFEENFVAPWPDSSKLVILTNLANPTVAPNLYTVSLK